MSGFARLALRPGGGRTERGRGARPQLAEGSFRRSAEDATSGPDQDLTLSGRATARPRPDSSPLRHDHQASHHYRACGALAVFHEIGIRLHRVASTCAGTLVAVLAHPHTRSAGRRHRFSMATAGWRRSLARQRLRARPMLPIGIPSLALISAVTTREGPR